MGAETTYDLIIFDCDGVLVDSERLSVRVDAEIYAELGWPLSEREIADRYVGRTHELMIAELTEHLGHRPSDEVLQRWTQRGREVFDAELEAVDGIVEALYQIELPNCVASSSSHSRLRYTLSKVGLYERFVGRIFSASEVRHGKPAPDLFLHAAEQMNVAPERCAVVEDSEFGVQAARAAGMTVYGYIGGDLIPAERLTGERTTLFDDMRKLPELLG